MRRGSLIALSGVDCAGKSTQRDRLQELLRARGHTVVGVYTRPGYTPGLRTLKTLARRLTGKKEHREERVGVSKRHGTYPRRAANLGHPLKRKLWLTAALLDLLLLHCVAVPFKRARGRTVLCNRHLIDCQVDFRVNFPDDRVEEGILWRLLARCHARPDAAFCFIIPAELTAARSRAKSRFHWESLEVLEARKRAYEELAREQKVAVLDGARSVEEVARSIEAAVAVSLPLGALQHG